MTNSVSAPSHSTWCLMTALSARDAGAAAACQPVRGRLRPSPTPLARGTSPVLRRPSRSRGLQAHIPDPALPACVDPGLLPDSRCRLWGAFPSSSPSLCGSREPQHTPGSGGVPQKQVTVGGKPGVPLAMPSRSQRQGPVPRRQLGPEPRSQAVSRVCTHGRWPPPSGCRQRGRALLALGPQRWSSWDGVLVCVLQRPWPVTQSAPTALPAPQASGQQAPASRSPHPPSGSGLPPLSQGLWAGTVSLPHPSDSGRTMQELQEPAQLGGHRGARACSHKGGVRGSILAQGWPRAAHPRLTQKAQP